MEENVRVLIINNLKERTMSTISEIDLLSLTDKEKRILAADVAFSLGEIAGKIIKFTEQSDKNNK